MPFSKELLNEFIREYPFQPATAFWRTVELAHLLQFPFPNGRGIDLGCGDGSFTRLLYRHLGERTTIGVDSDPQEAARALQSGVYQKVHTAAADRIPEPEASVDFVFSNSVLEHIPETAPILSEVSRVLKPGGQLLITVPSKQFHDGLRGPLLPWSSREAYRKKMDRRMLHRHYRSPDEWKNLLAENRLRPVSVTEYMNRAELRRFETLARWTSGILYDVFGQSKQPIEIQRFFGWRQSALKTPPLLANFMTSLFSMDFKDILPGENGSYACLRILAKKI